VQRKRKRRSIGGDGAAFRDAVRDILRDEGLFQFADARAPDVIWAYDGFRWMQKILGERAVDDGACEGASLVS
jgi:hypothetical protein